MLREHSTPGATDLIIELIFRPKRLRAVGRGTAVLHGVQIKQGEGEVLGVLFPIFTMGNAIGSHMVKCFRFIYENSTTFPIGKRIVQKLNLWAFWWYIRFQGQRRGLWEISKQVTIHLPKLRCTQQNDAARGALTAAAATGGQLAYSWMHGTVLHRPRPGQPAAKWPCTQITLDRLVSQCCGVCCSTCLTYKRYICRVVSSEIFGLKLQACVQQRWRLSQVNKLLASAPMLK